jgi:glycosyltransferase involved in cell wall biosynthesis
MADHLSPRCGPGQVRPSVTAIVATRDRLNLLRRAVASILAQRYDGAIECVVIFDRSEPVDMGIETRPGRTVRTMRNARAPGLAGARNTGILEATGELVAFCDDDDEWLPGKLDAQVAALGSSPGTAFVASGIEIVSDGRAVARVPPADRVTFDDLLRSRVQEVHPSSFVVRREAVLETIGLVDEEIPSSYGEDYEWMLRAAKAAPILVVRRPLVRVHWHRSSWFQDRWSVIVDAVGYLLERYPEFEQQPRGFARLQGRLAFAHAALGNRTAAREHARRSLAANPFERRAYLAYAVSSGVVPAGALVRVANRTGRGI